MRKGSSRLGRGTKQQMTQYSDNTVEGSSGGGMPKVAELLITIATAVVLAMILRAFVFEVFEVPTGSMLQTIQLDDRILGEKISYRFHEPAQGDIVTFNNPANDGTTLVKRVIAVGGQTVDLVDGRVVVDGEVLDEPYTNGLESLPLDKQMAGIGSITYPFKVPEGHIWVMGDNRTNSRDSRYFGAVPMSDVTSHAVWTIWPPSEFGAL